MSQRQKVKDDLVRALKAIGDAIHAPWPIEGGLHKYTIGPSDQFLQVDRTTCAGKVKAWLNKSGSDEVIIPAVGPWIDEDGLATWAEEQFGVADVAASSTALNQAGNVRQRNAPKRLVAAGAAAPAALPKAAKAAKDASDATKAAQSLKRPAETHAASVAEAASEPNFLNPGVQRLDAALAALEDTQLAESWCAALRLSASATPPPTPSPAV